MDPMPHFLPAAQAKVTSLLFYIKHQQACKSPHVRRAWFALRSSTHQLSVPASRWINCLLFTNSNDHNHLDTRNIECVLKIKFSFFCLHIRKCSSVGAYKKQAMNQSSYFNRGMRNNCLSFQDSFAWCIGTSKIKHFFLRS